MKRILLAVALATVAAGASAQVTFSGGTDQLISGVYDPSGTILTPRRADRRQARRYAVDVGWHADGDLPGL